MLTNLFFHGAAPPATPKEGELYKEVTVGGRSFRLVYGYYEDFERESPFNEPIPIYPDLLKNPVYTAKGTPIVTAMQDICSDYLGKADGDSCSECIHFQKNAELFGLCSCPGRAQSPPELEAEKYE